MRTMSEAELVVASSLKELVREIPDFPIPGIMFKDLNPILNDPNAFDMAQILMSNPYLPHHQSGTPWIERYAEIDKVAGIEARGFVFAAPIALRLGAGFVSIRKPGKLPYKTYKRDYTLEYGTNTLELHTDALKPGERVLIVDDVLASGGTMQAAAELVEQAGATVAGVAVFLNLKYVPRVKHWNVPVPVHSVLTLDT